MKTKEEILQEEKMRAEVRETIEAEKEKSRTIAFLLVFFLGGLGLHRFYVGKSGTGTAMLLMSVLSPFTLFLILPVVGIWAGIDMIIILIGNFKDNKGRKVVKW